MASMRKVPSTKVIHTTIAAFVLLNVVPVLATIQVVKAPKRTKAEIQEREETKQYAILIEICGSVSSSLSSRRLAMRLMPIFCSNSSANRARRISLVDSRIGLKFKYLGWRKRLLL